MRCQSEASAGGSACHSRSLRASPCRTTPRGRAAAASTADAPADRCRRWHAPAGWRAAFAANWCGRCRPGRRIHLAPVLPSCWCGAPRGRPGASAARPTCGRRTRAPACPGWYHVICSSLSSSRRSNVRGPSWSRARSKHSTMFFTATTVGSIYAAGN
jgi:hypothetical protein